MIPKSDKSYALLHIYEILLARNVVNRQEMAQKLGVSTKTITRYINDINAFLADEKKEQQIQYSRTRKGYVLVDKDTEHLNQKDILAISKILLESRAFNRMELEKLLNKLLGNCFFEDKTLIRQQIRSELANYTEVSHGKELIEAIWEISQAIKEQNVIEIAYTKITESGKVDEKPIIRQIEPQGILFSEYYFYLVAMIRDKNYDFPAIYRLDRIQSYHVLSEKFRIVYSQRFSEGEFRNLIQFMQAGKLQTVTFQHQGGSIEAVLDRLPNAQVIKEEEGIYTIKAKTFGRGINIWLLSQGEQVEVISPDELRKEMKRRLEAAVKKYE